MDEGHACLTNPDEAVEFIKQTKCDSLAAAIGTSHGAYKFKGQQSLHFEVIEGIRDKVKKAGLPPTPIVMHGSSSVPKSEVERINAAGGKLDPSARGVNEEEYLPAAKLGVTKVNIDTDGRLVWTRVHREFFRDHPEQFDFRPPGKIFVEEYANFIAHKNEKLGSAGKLDEVRASVKRLDRHPFGATTGAASANQVTFTLQELATMSGGKLLGDPAQQITGAASLAEATDGEVSFFNNPKYAAQLRKTRASAVFVPADFSNRFPRLKFAFQIRQKRSNKWC